jgi:hypothetical protein
MNLQLDILSLIEEGERLRDRGMKRALEHADAGMIIPFNKKPF